MAWIGSLSASFVWSKRDSYDYSVSALIISFPHFDDFIPSL